MLKLKIKGMTCEHCALTVKKALESVDNVKLAKVYFPQGYAEVYGDVNAERLIEAVNRAGYGAELIQESVEVYIPKPNVYDLFVLGGGSAGFASAIKASELGAKVLIANKNTIGGTCLNRGCIPSKYLIEIAKTYHRYMSSPFVESACGSIDMQKVLKVKEDLLERLRKEKYWNVLEAYPNIEYRDCEGRFLEGNRAVVGGEEVSFGKAVIAVGSKPAIPPIENINTVKYHTSDSIFNIDYIPEHLLVVGGGAIGLELGQAFLRIGSKVTLIEALEDILIAEEQELRKMLREVLEGEGMEIITGALVKGVEQEGRAVILKVQQNGRIRTIRGTDLLIAVGRTPNTENIGLEKVKVKTNKKGFIETNEFMQTSNPDYYAAGDCVGKLMLVTVAAVEGGIAAENALLGNRKRMVYEHIPRAVFTDPELASVGLKEEQARLMGYDVDVRILDFSKVPRAILSLENRGAIKIISDKKSGRILGIHILSPHGAELIHKGVLIVKYGLTVEDVVGITDAYPTLSESIKLCAQSFMKDITKLSCCVE